MSLPICSCVDPEILIRPSGQRICLHCGLAVLFPRPPRVDRPYLRGWARDSAHERLLYG